MKMGIEYVIKDIFLNKYFYFVMVFIKNIYWYYFKLGLVLSI